MTQVFVSCGFLSEDEVLALGPVVERLGFDGITLPDHLFLPATEPGAYPYSADGQPPFSLDSPWPDPIVLLAALAQVTSRVRLMTSVLIGPLRHPVVLAKAAATVARVSRGRFMLGMGVGWQREEFDAVGVEFAARDARADEMIEAMRALWQQGPATHHGRLFSFGPVLFEPVPPRIPILVGGASRAALRRAARLGDGYILPTTSLAETPAAVARVRTELEAAGGDLSHFELFVSVLDASEAELEPLLASGATGITVLPWPHPGKQRTSLSAKVEALEQCAADVLGVLKRSSTREASAQMTTRELERRND